MKTRRQITPEEVAVLDELAEYEKLLGTTAEQAARIADLRAKAAAIQASLDASEKDAPYSEADELNDLHNQIALTPDQRQRMVDLQAKLNVPPAPPAPPAPTAVPTGGA